MVIRPAESRDIEPMLEIYNREVATGTASFDIRPRTLPQWRSWFCAHGTGNHPLLVAELEGRVAGYACLSSYRDKEAYSATVELSVYVGEGFRRRGVATALMGRLLEMARQDPGTRAVVAVITSGNEASVALHEKFGFRFCGEMPGVGEKFGKNLGICNYLLHV